MVPQPPKSISILSHIFLTAFHNSDCIFLISSISSDRMNLELLAVLAIWLMLFPMADICRSSAARFSGGRGRISCPRIAARSNPEIVIPDNDACFFKCSYSFGVIQKSTAFSRFRMVHYSPFRPAAIGGIRGYPLNKPHLCIYKCYTCKDTAARCGVFRPPGVSLIFLPYSSVISSFLRGSERLLR